MWEQRWFIIVNPTAGNGKGQRLWPNIEKTLIQEGFDFEVAFTTHHLHAITLAEKALKQGFYRLIAIGGDGTLHQVVNGIMRQHTRLHSNFCLGVIPIGTGNDWVKSHGIPLNYKAAIRIIKRQKLYKQDIGCMQLERPLGPATVYFNNIAGIGYDAYVVQKVEAYKHLGAMAYLYGAVSGLFHFKNFEITVTHDNGSMQTNALMVLIGLCTYSGGGMKLTKNPVSNDGLFDLSIAHHFGPKDILKNLLNLFNGSITQHPKVETFKTEQTHIKTSANHMIQADGELIGTGNFKVTIIPKAISFICA